MTSSEDLTSEGHIERPDHSDMEFYIRGTDCGTNSRLMPHVLLGLIQETADKGATDTGFDRDFLYGLNACWIVLRMRIHLSRLPGWRERITIRTWSTGLDRISFDREYEIFDKNGNVIGYCTSVWILADTKTHRPLRPSGIKGLNEVYAQSDRLVYGEMCPKVSMPDRDKVTGDPVILKYADHSELDHNNHVNNTRYLAWAYDALDKYGIDLDSVEDLLINYFSEVHKGEKVEIHIVPGDSKEHVSVYGYREGGGKVFSAEITLCI